MGKRPWPVFIYGECGGGKSLAALCVADWAGDTAYVELPLLCAMLNDAAFGRLQEPDGSPIPQNAIWNNWREANLAIIDEIGARERASDAHYEALKLAIDWRVKQDKPLISISNLTIEEIARVYDDRMASRLASGTVLEVTEDRRLQ